MNPEIPGYRILREIGKGGMGVVYRAVRESDQADVAVKVLPTTLITPTTAKRFRREGQALMSLEHPNVVQVHEVNCHEGCHYIAMEYIAGKPLSRLIRSHPEGVPLEIGVRYAVQVGRALSAIHARGMIHRDLKPGNVMIIAETGTAKLLDFGLVQVEGLTMLTATGSILGTPLYMSPEQCAGTALDLRTDVYSFGVLLFHLFTGEPPFQSASAYELLQMQQNDVPTEPTSLRSDLPPTIAQIILRCLEKDPSDRYTGLTEAVTELENLAGELGVEPDSELPQSIAPPEVSAKPMARPTRSRPRPRRKAPVKTLAALAACVATGVIALHPALEQKRNSLSSTVKSWWTEWAAEAEAQTPTRSPATEIQVEVDDQYERARRASIRWNEGRALEAQEDHTAAFAKYCEAATLYARSAFLKKVIELATRLDRHEEAREIIGRALLDNPRVDVDGSLKRYLGGES